jgi:hypothetical protein
LLGVAGRSLLEDVLVRAFDELFFVASAPTLLVDIEVADIQARHVAIID